jgi:SSS family solute:Na+ symporter
MRGVVAMDMKNGVIMLSFMLLAIIAISLKMGGASEVNKTLFQTNPELFSKSGANGFFTPLKWVSFMLLWLACLPMFPQIFSRFLMSKDLKTFKQSTLLYTLIPTFLFIIPVMIGVFGHVDFLGLVGKESDKILPMVLAKHTPLWVAALVLTGALAAFISTVDSLILALSTILTRDVFLEHIRKDISHEKQVQIGKLIVLFLAIISMLIALERPASIFKMVTMTFSGSALLFPITLLLFYWKKTTAIACSIALIGGELLLAALTFKWIDTSWIGSALPVLPALIFTFFLIFILSILLPKKSSIA